MKFRRLSIFSIPGISQLPDDNDIILIAPGGDQSICKLTMDVSAHLEHIRIRTAFAHLLMSAFVSISPDIASTLTTAEDRLNYALSTVTINVDPKLVYLVVEAVEDLHVDPFQHTKRIGEVGVFIDDIDLGRLETKADSLFHSSFTGLSLSFSEHPIDTVTSVGSAIWVEDEQSGHRLYAMRPKFSARATVSRALSPEEGEAAEKLSSALMQYQRLGNCARLLSQASERFSDRLLSFLSAWTGFELFIQEVFRTTYEPCIYESFSEAVPSPARRYVAKIRETMESKYNIREKFIAIASILDDKNAEGDIDSFIAIKKLRDNLAHAMKGDIEALPSEKTQALARKYLRLHLINISGLV